MKARWKIGLGVVIVSAGIDAPVSLQAVFAAHNG